jgi:hypothetical protein
MLCVFNGFAADAVAAIEGSVMELKYVNSEKINFLTIKTEPA